MIKPFTAPPFNITPREYDEPRYVWWSWNPNYPYWSRSCWEGPTEDKAWKALENPNACKMRYYHNKLILENHGTYTEIADMPFDPSKVGDER